MLAQLSGAAFVVGLLGGVHCAGMCGGLATALAGAGRAPFSGWRLQAAYSFGRVGSYAFAGALAGTLAGAAVLMEHVLPVQFGFYVLANLMLIALGLYLAGWHSFLTWLERPGRRLWRHLNPWMQRFMPVDSWGKALAVGGLWGWIPCGLVYSMLSTAMLAGDAAGGATVMLAFGLGTIPNVMGAGLLLRHLRGPGARPVVRIVAGGLVASFGVFGLLRASSLMLLLRQGLACIV
ncbi:MAG: sulfite exporter TauE/SafE family protein [Betaproteobacteria bacterium]|nr:sulfite exporter TauE/SafE family protein [Betaproteobacteria bacterium]